MTQFINDFAELKKYRTELPNLYDDLGLDVYEFRLLAHYKRVGTCTEGSALTAKVCGMSIGQLSQTRQRLADKNLIILEKKPVPGGFGYTVEVVDLWFQNFLKYSKMTKDEALKMLQASYSESQPSPHEAQPSRGAYKEESSSSIFSNFENNISLLTPMLREKLLEAEKEFPEDWINEAIQIAVDNNKRSWAYIETILRRWKSDGKDSGRGGKKEPEPTRPEYQKLPTAAEEEDWVPAPGRRKVNA